MRRLEARRRCERVDRQPVPEREGRRVDHVLGGHLVPSRQRRGRLRALDDRHVRAMARHARANCQLSDRRVQMVRHADGRQRALRRGHLLGEHALRRLPRRDERGGVRGERLPSPHDLAARLRLDDSLDLDAQADPVGDLRPQIALLLVHRAHEQEPRRVRDRDALSLDDVHAERRRVEQDVRQVVVEEVDLVDVEDAAVRLGEQPRLQRPLALTQRPRDVDRARDAVLGRVQRQIDDSPPSPRDRKLVPSRDWHDAHGSAGEHEKGQSATTSISGSSSDSPRTAVDFPVPAGPTTSTPPTAGFTALSRSACLRRSCSTIAAKGK